MLCDADVDAADLHLLLDPDIKKRCDFMGGSIAEIDTESCTQCGVCRQLCRFDAIDESFVVNDLMCEGCGVCVEICPENSIRFPVQKSGEWFISHTRFGPMIHARLGIAEENSGKLVTLIRKEARILAEKEGFDFILTDGPPGIGCPVIASISGATVLVIVVEPTVSGLHDMIRVADLAAYFRIHVMVIVNKYDLNIEMTKSIEQKAQGRNMTLLGRIPFDPLFTESMVQRKNIFEYGKEGETLTAVQNIWTKIMQSPFMNTLGNMDFQATIK